MRRTYKILYRTLAPLLKVLFRVHGHGQENEPPTGTSFVVCANHISELDPICINIILGKTEPYYMAKAVYPLNSFPLAAPLNPVL